MYTYYGFRAMRFNIPKWVNIAITSGQISQMIIGIVVNLVAYSTKKRGEQCAVTDENIQWSFIMYFSYFLLFFHFFYNAYISKSSKKSQKQNGTTTTTNTTAANGHLSNGKTYQNGNSNGHLKNGEINNNTIQNGNGYHSNDKKHD